MIKLRHSSIKQTIHIALLATMSLVCVWNGGPVQAITSNDLHSIQENLPFIDRNDVACTVNSLANFVSGGPVKELTGATPKEKVFNYLTTRGLSKEQAAGLMGNMQVESGFQPDNQENSKPWPTGGWGLIQWTGGRRLAVVAAMEQSGIGALYSEATADGKTPADKVDQLMLFELDYVWQELQTTHKAAFTSLTTAATVRDASTAILSKFEIPKNWQNQIDSRAALGESIFREFTGSSTTTAVQTLTSTTGSGADSSGKTVIALDPGHGAEIPQYVDNGSQLADRETNNLPEGDDVLDIAKRVKAELESAGYSVLLLRTDSGQAVTKRARVDAAVAAKASLVVSLHTTPGAVNEVWPQRVGTYREYLGHTVTLTNADVAKKSQSYADTIANARKVAEGHDISLDPNNTAEMGSFARDDIPSKGNVSLVQLWGQNVPWVYNEIGQDSGTALSESMKQKYTTGLVQGIEKAVPAANATTSGTCGTSGLTDATGLTAKTLEYAWPVYKGLTVEAKPEWVAAYTAARKAGHYIGGISFPGIDCGGFVTNLVIDSGFDPTYNHNGLVKDGAGATATQYQWMLANWEDLGGAATIDTAKLQPGDVAITRGSGHTFIYVGPIFPDKKIVLASASLDERAPMADSSQRLNEERFEWFRKKSTTNSTPSSAAISESSTNNATKL